MELGKNYCYGIEKNSNNILMWPLLFTKGDPYYRISVSEGKPWNHKRRSGIYLSDSMIRKIILKRIKDQISCPRILDLTQEILVESCKKGTINFMYIEKDGRNR